MILNFKYFNIPSSSVKIDLAREVQLVVFTELLTNPEAELLSKMMLATGLQESEYLHCVLSETKPLIKDLLNQENSLKIIIFDCPLQQLGLNLDVKKYKVFRLHQAELVIVDDLTSIAGEKPLKKYIWNLFKTWFVNA